MIETEAPDTTSVEALTQVLEKSLRTVSLYLPNNVVYRQAMQNVEASFAAVWSEGSSLVLQVTETDLMWEGAPVLPIGDRSESLTWALFLEGIRSLTMSPGVESEEIAVFLQAVHKSRTLTDDDADDLPTLLWDSDFEHIQYKVAEAPQGDGEAPIESSGAPPQAPAEDVREQLREDAGDDAPERPKGIVDMEDFDATLYFLDKGEIDYLKAEIDREYQQNLGSNVLAILFDIFELQKDAEARAEILGILAELLPHFLSEGNFESVGYLIGEARLVLGRAPALLSAHRKLLEHLTRKLSQPEAVEQMLSALDHAHARPDEEELSKVFEELKPEAMNTVLKWLRKLPNEQAREMLANIVIKMAQANPRSVSVALESPERIVVLEGLRLVTQLGLVDQQEHLGTLTEHEDVSVRSALVDALNMVGTGDTMRYMVKLIDDSDVEIRIAALTALGARKFHPALERVKEMAVGKELRAMDLNEKRAVLAAYGSLAGEEALDHFKTMLLGKGFGVGRADAETRACAATALGMVRSKSARTVLQKAAKDKEPVVKYAALKALSGEAS